MGKKIRRAAVGAATAAAGMAAALTFAAAPASAATGYHLTVGWNDHCNYSGHSGCLYYSQQGAGGIMSADDYISNLGGLHFSDGNNVWHNAASIGNYTTNCGSTTWQGTSASGDFNWVSATRGANLNSYLRNNEASFDPAASCA
jgi:hypothetical protein